MWSSHNLVICEYHIGSQSTSTGIAGDMTECQQSMTRQRALSSTGNLHRQRKASTTWCGIISASIFGSTVTQCRTKDLAVNEHMLKLTLNICRMLLGWLETILKSGSDIKNYLPHWLTGSWLIQIWLSLYQLSFELVEWADCILGSQRDAEPT